MKDAYQKFRGYTERIDALEHSMVLWSWDIETLMPEAGMEGASLDMSILSEMRQELFNEPELAALVQALIGEETDVVRTAELKKMKKALYEMQRIPPQELRDFTQLQASATQVWAKARQNNDFASFAPVLKELLRYKIKFAEYCKKPEQSVYDYMLGEFEEGMTTEVLDDFFDKLRRNIAPLLKDIIRHKDRVPADFLRRPVAKEKQKAFAEWVLPYIGFDMKRGVMAESAHPFTSGISRNNVRLTTHYYEALPISSIFSTIHEGGHGIYEQGITDSDLVAGSWVCDAISMGVHESQSRFYENIIGRSLAFWKPIYEKLREMTGEWEDIALEDFVRALNAVAPDMIRTEADEVCYSLHIMVRYELEKRLFAGELSVDDLPGEWNRLYEEYLGITPKNDAEGVLQDIHWSMGSFGYFPSYALGNAYAAQLYHQMQKELPVDELLAQGDLPAIRRWLSEKVHRYGATETSDSLLSKVTGEPFNPQYYIDYLTEKFSAIYGLSS